MELDRTENGGGEHGSQDPFTVEKEDNLSRSNNKFKKESMGSDPGQRDIKEAEQYRRRKKAGGRDGGGRWGRL